MIRLEPSRGIGVVRALCAYCLLCGVWCVLYMLYMLSVLNTKGISRIGCVVKTNINGILFFVFTLISELVITYIRNISYADTKITIMSELIISL